MSAVAIDAGPSRPLASVGLGWLRERGMGSSILVAAISTAFGALLLSTTGYLGALLRADPTIGDAGSLQLVVGILSVLFIGVAVYVAAVVTANTFATIIAGRVRQIALLRLIGSTARGERARVARQGVGVGLIGALVGLAVAIVAGLALLPLADRAVGTTVGYVVLQPVLLAPAAVVVLTTWGAAWAGSRRVLTVTPLQAIGGSAERGVEEVSRRPVRNVLAIGLVAVGVVLLAAGVALGLVHPGGVVIAFLGGAVSFAGLALAATLVMPPLLRLVGRAFGRGVTARLAAENALRYPERSSRMSIGVVIGVTLVTMFAVAMETTKSVLAAASGGRLHPALASALDGFATIMMGLVAVAAVIAAVGLVNLLTIGVVQRRRELGLLRALGLSKGQIRRMVLLEASHVTVTAVVLGLVLGTVYGWAGAQATLGSVGGGAFVAPSIPWITVGVIVGATTVLTLIAAVVPTRLATRVPPVEALASE